MMNGIVYDAGAGLAIIALILFVLTIEGYAKRTLDLLEILFFRELFYKSPKDFCWFCTLLNGKSNKIMTTDAEMNQQCRLTAFSFY